MLLGVLFRLGALALSLLISLSTWSNVLFRWFSPVIRYEQVLYDFIVVGGGSAGSTVAGRLSENGFSVLLIEAGGSPPSWATFGTIDIPVFGPLWQRTDLDWAYSTESQTHACGALKEKASLWPRGRVLGGSGRLNNMVYLRGHRNDWKEWGFSTSSQLHYFKKSELHLGRYRSDAKHHSSDGWMPVSDMSITSELSSAVLKAAKELGYFIGDLNTMSHTGFMKVQTTTQNGARFSSDNAFLYSKKRPNLHVLTHALVTQVLLDEHNVAKGVKFHHQTDSWHQVRSRFGVILSAGAIESPKILLLSGIGPANHLQDVGIPPKVLSSEVGKNLLDHVSTGSDLVLLNSSLTFSLFNLAHPQSFFDYALSGKGLLTHGGCEATALLHTNLSDPSKDPPDIQLLVLPAGQTFDGGYLLRHNTGVDEVVWDKYFSNNNDVHKPVGVTILVILLHPRSHGEVRLKSVDPFQPPLIDPKYLTDLRDVETLVEGIKVVKKLLKTEAMTEIGAYLNPKHIPGCEDYKFDSRDYWQCYVRMLSYTVYHPAGTCKMGSEGKAVVDHSFRVHGVKNLHVVDASVMPTLPSANINAAVIALAERAADTITSNILKKDQKKTPQQTYFSVMKLCWNPPQ